jgi:uncharacterized protein YbaP (TraB family)
MRRTAPRFGSISSLLLPALVALLGGCGSSSTPVATPEAAASEGSAAPARAAEGSSLAAVPAPFLWEVRSGEHVSHLLGTIHVGVTLDRALPEPHRSRLLEARGVVVEADPSSLGAQATMQAMMLPPERTLSAVAGSAVFGRLAEELGEDVPAAVLERLRPWAASAVFVQHWVSANVPGAPAEGMDLEIIAGARARGQRLLFLEEAQAQLDILRDVPDGFFLDSLGEILTEEGEAERQIGGLLRSYLAGDVAGIEALLFDAEDVRTSPEYYDLFLYRRNAAWMIGLEPLLRAEGGIFVAVGLAHMLGPRGLVEALRAKGFTVTRVE